MKVLILGGAGLVGSHIVSAIAHNPRFSQIIIGERNIDDAMQLAQKAGDKVSARQLDITDAVALDAALADCDVVVSCVGPYYRFGSLVLSTAIQAGKHYIDVCDDWEPALDMLALSDSATEAGVSAVVGMGASPGTTNLLAALAHNALDHTDTLYTIWGIGDLMDEGENSEDETSSQAALEHWLLQASGKIRVQQDGQLQDIKPLQEKMIDFPGYGQAWCHSLGHPEPVTLPLTFPAVQHSLNLMNMPHSVIEALQKTAQELDAGQLDMAGAVEQLARRLGERGTVSELVSGVNLVLGFVREKIKGMRYLPSLAGMAVGEKGGVPARAGSWCNGFIAGGTGAVTGIPVAAVLEMLADGLVTRHGVYAPEGVIDPERYFAYLEKYMVRPKKTADTPLLRVLVEKR